MLSVIDISLSGVVQIVLYLLAAAAVLGLLWWLVTWIQGTWGGPDVLYKAIKTVIVIFVVLLLIAVLLSFLGEPLFNLHR